jgi:hypothetical protein
MNKTLAFLCWLLAASVAVIAPVHAESVVFLGGSPCLPPPTGGTYDNVNFAGDWPATATRATLTTNILLSPGCVNNGATLTEDTSSSASHFTQKNFVATITAAKHTSTVAVRRVVGERYIFLRVCGSLPSGCANSVFATIDPGACTFQKEPDVAGTYSTPSGWISRANQWCLVQLSAIYAADTEINFQIELSTNSTFIYTGDGVSSIAMWGYDWR